MQDLLFCQQCAARSPHTSIVRLVVLAQDYPQAFLENPLVPLILLESPELAALVARSERLAMIQQLKEIREGLHIEKYGYGSGYGSGSGSGYGSGSGSGYGSGSGSGSGYGDGSGYGYGYGIYIPREIK